MTSYRIYFLNGQGRIMRALDVECENDEEAGAKARDLLDGQPIEVWQRARLVGRFDP